MPSRSPAWYSSSFASSPSPVTTAAAARTPEVGRSPPARLRRHRGIAVAVALAAVVLVLVPVRLFALVPVEVSSASMTPTVRPGGHVLTARPWLPGVSIGRGDLVTFRSPVDGRPTLKRVAGVAGDVVEIRDGDLFVNAKAVHEPYVDHATMDSVYFGPVTVPVHDVFVLGDNRANSVDSRDFGALPTSRLTGLVIWRY